MVDKSRIRTELEEQLREQQAELEMSIACHNRFSVQHKESFENGTDIEWQQSLEGIVGMFEDKINFTKDQIVDLQERLNR